MIEIYYHWMSKENQFIFLIYSYLGKCNIWNNNYFNFQTLAGRCGLGCFNLRILLSILLSILKSKQPHPHPQVNLINPKSRSLNSPCTSWVICSFLQLDLSSVCSVHCVQREVCAVCSFCNLQCVQRTVCSTCSEFSM